MNYFGNPESLPKHTRKKLREYGRLGGIASGKARRKRAENRKAVYEILEEQFNTCEDVIRFFKKKHGIDVSRDIAPCWPKPVKK